MNLIIRNILRFIAMILIQGLLLNEIDLGVFVNPYLYVICIILLPVETPDWLLILAAFLLGILIDTFTNTLGLHASACVFMAFVRPKVLQFLKPRDGYETGSQPGLFIMGSRWFLYYSAILIGFHHAWFFILEFFRLSDAGYILLKILASSFCTWILVILTQLLTGKKQIT